MRQRITWSSSEQHTLASEHEARGEHVTLDLSSLDTPTKMLRPQAHIGELMHKLPWSVTFSRRVPTKHVNLTEIESGIEELRSRCRDPAPYRYVNGVDSRVMLGAWGKGRSSSIQVNISLKQVCASSVVLRKKKAGTKAHGSWNINKVG